MKNHFNNILLTLIAIWVLATIIPLFKNKITNNITSSKLKHLGLIMDGNRRWARKKGLPTSLGHKEGVKPFKMTIKYCIKHKIPYLTTYAFSLENFKRSKEELDYLFNILAKELAGEEFNSLVKNGVKVKFIGDATKFPKQLKNIIKDLEQKSAKNKKLNLNLLFCYGGQQEILAAVKKIANQVQAGKINSQDIDLHYFEKFLWLNDTPPVDLIIRTGKRNRLSNFLPYQSVYSEIYFSDLYWPDMTEKKLNKIIENFKNSKRTFGK